MLGAVFFVLFAGVHVLRLALRWPVTLNGSAVPLWVSAVAALIAVSLGVMIWREARTR
jgi:hypothetical protein